MNDVKEIELSLEFAKELVERRDMVRRLTLNPEFKKLVSEGYFKDEAARLVGLLSDPSAASHRQAIQEAMIGISNFQSFLRDIVRMGNVAADEIGDYEEALDEARGEELVA